MTLTDSASEQGRIPAVDATTSGPLRGAWTHTRNDAPRGYIDFQRLDELWLHTGTACNLSCPFCLEGSRPGDDRLNALHLAEVQPFLDEAVDLGVKQFSFTGGEPFVIKGFIDILRYASERRPCFVLTNATDPLLRRAHQLLPLVSQPFPIRFRVSLDYPDPSRHDRDRGEGSFAKALQGIRWLHEQGFDVSVARQQSPEEDAEAVEAAFRRIFKRAGLPEDLAFTAFPDFGTPGSDGDSPEITEQCMEKYPTEASRAHFMCSYSRMLVKQQGRIKVYACTLVDDDPDYAADSLRDSLDTRVMLRHHRCFSCYRFGASCSAP
ncbi:radical SAM protein [Modicisalibacter xianhensis]|uniref:Radical SAM superfamily protein n=1 Tax=Modicisalibacter xianhensis TaxID=442341 RepID=A0A1I2XZJ0_9GAMM|nr:radical SAM protein [Halomonas xianhensis]SFH18509.1 Radical SAM superfamily protein [Halomonas xianhensis]